MPEYLSPGVYVEEIDAGPKPIEGVSTSTTGAVGVTSRGPSRGKPELVTSFAEFTRKFGGFLEEPDPGVLNQWALDPNEGGRWWQFPLAVKGFFDNGGQRLFVKRVFSAAGAVASNETLGQGVITELTQDADPTDDTLRVRHLLGVQNGSAVTIVAGGSPLAGPFNCVSYDGSRNEITLNAPVGQELRAGRDFIEVIPRVAPVALPVDTRTLTVRAKSVGLWGDDLLVRVRPMVGASLKILADPALGGNTARTTLVVPPPNPL
ncbi:MAG: phage tail protein, partial [Bryobacteraceae bacterium]